MSVYGMVYPCAALVPRPGSLMGRGNLAYLRTVVDCVLLETCLDDVLGCLHEGVLRVYERLVLAPRVIGKDTYRGRI